MLRLFKVNRLKPFLLLFLVLLTACWDKVELEERAYVISIGIDKQKQEDGKADSDIFAVSMALPSLAATGKDSGNEEKTVKSGTGKTISSAIGSTDGFSGKKLYFGHAKLIVLNEDILKDDKLFKETIDALERNEQISGRAIVLCGEESAKKILEAKPPAESMVGMFVTSFFRSGHNMAGTSFKQDLFGIISELQNGGNVIIPKIELKGEELKIGGGALISGFRLDGWLTETEMQGYLFAKGKAEGAVLDIESDEVYLPLYVRKNRSKISFADRGDTIICHTDIKIEGDLTGFLFGETPPDPKELAKKYELLVLDEIKKADEHSHLFEQELLNEMKSRSSKLYNAYKNGGKSIELVWNVTVKVEEKRKADFS